MARICISYRRLDRAIAGRIFDRLTAHYGGQSVFMDVTNIPPGTDFRHFYNEKLLEANVLLVIIGRKWVGQTKDGKGLHNDNDPVRIEVETALQNGKPIVPLLVEGAKMPSENQVPKSLKDLVFKNALIVNSGPDFDHHIGCLFDTIDENIPKEALRPQDLHPRGCVTVRAVDKYREHIKFDIFIHDKMTFQGLLTKAYWMLNAHDVEIYEYTYGKAWMLLDGPSRREYRKVESADGQDIRLLADVGIRPGQVLDFTRL